MTTAPPLPSTRRMVGRALLRRCPVCGQRRIFRQWFRLSERCPGCGLRFERIEGHWTGALGINTILSFGTLLLTLACGIAMTYPDIPAVPLLVGAVLVAALTPFIFFPYSKTIWLTIDLMMRPLEPGEARVVTGSTEAERS